MRVGQFKIDKIIKDSPQVEEFLNSLEIHYTEEQENAILYVAEFEEFDDIDEVNENLPIYIIKFYQCSDGIIRLPVERWK